MIRKVLGIVITVLLVAFVIWTVNPAWFGPKFAELALTAPAAQVIAMRGTITVGFVALAAIFALFGAVFRVLRGRGTMSLTLAVVFLAGAVFHGLVIFDRGYSAPALETSEPLLQTAAAGDLTTLQYNTRGGNVPLDKIAELIVNNDVKAVSLPETSTEYGRELVAQLAAQGLHFQQFDHNISRYESDWYSTVLLISADLGEYAEVSVPGADGNAARYIVAAAPVAGVSATAPEFVAAHPITPVQKLMEQWRTTTGVLYELCTSQPEAIIMGDFNSTADHQRLAGYRSCHDLGRQAGIAGTGTWPTVLPAFLASPIDRVITGSENWQGVAGQVVDAGGSDHRGILVRLRAK
ncbi:endonuclease/exonuclease/phosphatase family protein [Actinobaculum suis]|uniref:endonuclease/exonuclease/phosphatase family protein n=1 Tax=Actinobaculum suis TaxID=1657 RepID=UPI00080874A8|nr:endonuclease/exonuclease/phosphatase family protein [Actinobaculum suis]OCA94873.1 hypothetical protein ACU20_05775 [Actinobaculum suis]OCA95461.1 hypothetical protein ACU21_03995 [Actinobaculum suis]